MAPVMEKVLVPGLPSVPMVLNQSAPFKIMPGTLAKVSTLFKTVGFAHRPLSTVRGGFYTRHTSVTFNGSSKGRAFTADKSAGAPVNMHMEGEIRSKDVIT